MKAVFVRLIFYTVAVLSVAFGLGHRPCGKVKGFRRTADFVFMKNKPEFKLILL